VGAKSALRYASLAKAMLYVAVVTAIFTVFMPIALKRASTASARYCMDSFTVYLVAVLSPPRQSAIVTAKGFGLSVWYLYKGLTAIAAKMFFLIFTAAE
jgi:hypothetical protein